MAVWSNKSIGQGRFDYDVCTTRAMDNPVRLLRLFIRPVNARFGVDMHSQRLYLKSLKMGFMGNEVHKIGKLPMYN
jgi:hypothetical protein